MMIPSKETLLYYNEQGIIPGPAESEEDFFKRAEYCLSLKDSLAERLGKEFSFQEKIPENLWESPWKTTDVLYGIKPTWIPIFFSNHRLHFWHGGSAWIFQQNEETPTSSFFQLRRTFRHSDTYLGIYHRDEIIAHELCHVGRMLFEEPQYEEILAYQSSPSKLRRWLGPIVQSPWESALFVFLLFFILILDISILAVQPDLFIAVSWVKLIPLGFIAYGCLRLSQRQYRFKKCLNHLNQALGTPLKANAVIYRLTDSEIEDFAKKSPEEILEFALKQTSFRWKLLQFAYIEKQT